jgi:hypothetical protein
MNNPQGPGKQRKDKGNKAPQPHHQAAGAPGRSEQQHQPGQRGDQQHHQQHNQQHHGQSSQSMKDDD